MWGQLRQEVGPRYVSLVLMHDYVYLLEIFGTEPPPHDGHL
jgi:hypothetical protein